MYSVLKFIFLVSPSFYSMNLLMIGKCFLKINEKDKGVLYLKKAKDHPIKTADDKEVCNT